MLEFMLHFCQSITGDVTDVTDVTGIGFGVVTGNLVLWLLTSVNLC